ncbi:hypothetical protein D3C81_1349060 [compost metagenome]
MPIDVAIIANIEFIKGAPTSGIKNLVLRTIGNPNINGSFIPKSPGSIVNFPKVL